jgi:hypothetical protein
MVDYVIDFVENLVKMQNVNCHLLLSLEQLEGVKMSVRGQVLDSKLPSYHGNGNQHYKFARARLN